MDGGTQPRAAIDDTTARDYADAMTEGAQFPPVVIFYDGSDHWLADGFHRVHAALLCGLLDIDADVRQGTRRDAVLYSVGANADHGMRRTNADKRRAVEVLLRDAEWGSWSNREVARRCGVADTFVADMKASLQLDRSENPTYTTKHGTEATMRTGNIGRREAEEEPIESPCLPPTPVRKDNQTQQDADAITTFCLDISARVAQLAGLDTRSAVLNAVRAALIQAIHEGRITVR